MAENLLTGVTRVGDLVTTLWDFSLGPFVNLILLGKNAERLEEQMSLLQELRADLSNLAEQEAQQPMMEVTDQVSGWINRVDNLRLRVAKFQDSFERRSICVTGFCLGYDALQLQKELEKLMEEGYAFPSLSRLSRQRRPTDFQDVPLEIPSSSLVGAEKTMLEIQGHIMDDAVRVIGICGMGGAGKTTLLKVINNKFLREGEARDMFNLSIWVTLSRAVDILDIQKSIVERLGLTLSSSRQGEPSTDGILRRQQADILSVELSKKRFILFLDDIWEGIDLMAIGIPYESKQHKILFTTRSEGVCRQMNADQVVRVGLLDLEDSWTLFQSKMGKNIAAVDNPDVRKIAKQVVAKCGGLPITLITVGRAMAYATTIHEWRDALHALDQRVEEVIGMEPVLASLKFCFDRLNNTSLQSCLLYCAFYPEDWDIPKEEIIDYWISEGFLDPEGYIDTHIGYTRDRGHAWIRRLRSACLLEDGNFDETIRLNDSIRDMLMWIGKEEYVMLAGKNIAQIPRREIWERAKGISLMHNKAPSFFWELRCEALTTLILQMTDFGRTIQKGFFARTPSLRVLDLSYTQIEALPSDITTLVELRYLSLEHTGIESLPEELGELTNLRYLNLNYTYLLMEIPREAVSRLISLQVLKMKGSGYSFSAHSELGLSDLENLGLLCELSATVKACSYFLHDIAVSNTFSGCIRELEVWPEDQEVGDITLTFGPGHFPNLKFLQLSDLKEAEIVIKPAYREYQTGSKQPIFERLQKLMIYRCHGLRDLTWVGQLPLLEMIDIFDCEKITELLLLDGGDLPNDGRTILTRLKYMSLYRLPSLRSISKHVLHFPSLEGLIVKRCPKLRTLPFGPGSAEGIRWIRGEPEWWDELEWDQPGVKSYFFKRFAAWDNHLEM